MEQDAPAGVVQMTGFLPLSYNGSLRRMMASFADGTAIPIDTLAVFAKPVIMLPFRDIPLA
jgi:hypothetical protein